MVASSKYQLLNNVNGRRRVLIKSVISEGQAGKPAPYICQKLKFLCCMCACPLGQFILDIELDPTTAGS